MAIKLNELKKNNRIAETLSVSLISIIAVLLLTGCRAPLPKEQPVRRLASPPKVRVGILEKRDFVALKIRGASVIKSEENNFVLRSSEDAEWRVDVVDARPAQMGYRLAVVTTKDRFEAEEKVRELHRAGILAHIKKIDVPRMASLPYVQKSAYQVLINEAFPSEQQAQLYQGSIRDKFETDVIEEMKVESEGTLRFTNLLSKYSFDTKGPVSIQADEVELADVDVGSGFHWETSETRTYEGTLEFLVDRYGKITVVDELFVEDYLKGVVPSEMPASFPEEALKAQAVAARVESFSKVGVRHISDPFDLCDDVHCQAFTGKGKQSQKTDAAVEATKGLVLVYRNQLCNAFYAGVCGGHTEDNENVWNLEAKPYLRGILDSDNKRAQRLGNSLQSEPALKKWIDSQPDVYCNTLKLTNSRFLNYSKKYFRWQFTYKRSELERIIRTKTGQEFGTLIDLKPLKRGVSGRLIELQIVGTKKKFTISRELAIRQAVSKSTLYSGCFYIERIGKNNIPDKFVLKGAGWGHGVGMCQVGAAVMAQSGVPFDKILRHYYRNSTLAKLY